MIMVTNKQYETAYRNPEYIKIMNKASACYFQTIPIDELHRCKLMALWEALERYREDAGKKFTSYLYDIVTYHCWKWVNNPENKISMRLEEDPEIEDFTQKLEIADALSTLPSPVKEILYARYYEKKKLREIADTHGFSIDTVRRRIKSGINQLRESFF